MVSTVSLWLPILLSAVLVFVVSSIIHMVLTYHRSDYRRLPQEDAVMDSLRPFDIPPGEYAMPYCTTSKEMQDPAFRLKLDRGPVGFLTFCSKDFNMPLSLLQNSIWYKRAWSTTLKSVADGFVYALVTAGTFGWLWPAA